MFAKELNAEREKNMNIRCYNARILTMNEGEDVFWGEVWICEERIIYVGESKGTQLICDELAIEIPDWDREIDCKGNFMKKMICRNSWHYFLKN